MKIERKSNHHAHWLSKFITICILLCMVHFTSAQPPVSKHVFQDWNTTSGTQNFFYKNVSKTDGSGNVYIAGSTLNTSGDYDILLKKYDSSGSELWTAEYAGAAGMDDMAADIYVDVSGNVFVTGAAVQNLADSQDLILIKYNSSGTQQWVSFYNNSSGSPVKYDGGTCIAMDNSGNIYVGGGSVGNATGSDYITIKYSPLGTQQWIERYDYNGNNDMATKIQYNNSTARTIVSGASQRTATRWDYATISYGLAAIPSIVRASGTADGIDEVSDMQMDALGNIYITGTSKNTGTEYDFKTIKLNSGMVEEWSVEYDGVAHLDDRSNALRVDNSGNVYVTGYTTTAQGRDYATIKYNSSGIQQWVQYYDGIDHRNDESNALVVDGLDNVYVTGQSFINGNLDYHTVKYNNSGTKLWEIGYNALANGQDKAVGISLDGAAGIIVSGQTETSTNTYAYTTVRYIESSLYNIPDPYNEPIPTSFECIQNRGQLIHTDNSAATEVKYYTKNTSPYIYFQAKTASLVWAKNDFSSVDSLHTDTLYRVDMVMGEGKGNNGFGLNAYKSYHNFYAPYLSNEVEKVNSYNTIVYPNIYPDIDVYYTAYNSGIRTQFVIKPSGSASSISIDFEGASSVNVDGNGDLIVATSIGSMKFLQARVFQIDSLGNGDTLAWQPSYNITSHTLTFSGIGPYNSALPLVIEMYEKKGTDDNDMDNLTWSTLYGNDLPDAGAVIKTDEEDNIFVYGGTIDQNFPLATSQVFNPNAYKFAFLIKFDTDGILKWSTIFGNSHMAYNPATEGVTENIKDMAIGNDGYIYFCGTLAYDLDFTEKALDGSPIAYTSSAVSLVNDRASYIGRAKITTGELNWTQLFVGTQRKLLFNENNELYMIGEGGDNTTNTGLPLTDPGSGAYYNETGYGTITKFNTDLSIAYCTRFASETRSALTAIAPGPNNSVYIAGYSQNSNFPESATGSQYTQSYTSSAEGSTEGIVFQLGESHDILWASYLGGNHREVFNAASFSQIPNNKLCLVGWTNSTNFPTEQGSAITYQPSNLNADTSKKEAIILLFDDENALAYSSYYGSQYNEALNAVAAAPDGRFFMGGYTDNDHISTIPYSVYYNQAYNNRADALVLGMDDSGNLFWITCVGGKGPDQIHGMTMMHNDRLFLTGQTSARDNPSGEPFPTIDNGNPGAFFDGEPGSIVHNYNMPDVFITEFSVLPTLSIHENQGNVHSMLVYPNPTESILNLIFYSIPSATISINIIDLTGKIVQTHNFSESKGTNTFTLDISTLPRGIFILRLINGNEYKNIKFIKL